MDPSDGVYSRAKLLALRPERLPGPGEIGLKLLAFSDPGAGYARLSPAGQRPRRRGGLGLCTEVLTADAEVLYSKRQELRNIERQTGAEIKEKKGVRDMKVLITGSAADVEKALPLVEQLLGIQEEERRDEWQEEQPSSSWGAGAWEAELRSSGAAASQSRPQAWERDMAERQPPTSHWGKWKDDDNAGYEPGPAAAVPSDADADDGFWDVPRREPPADFPPPPELPLPDQQDQAHWEPLVPHQEAPQEWPASPQDHSAPSAEWAATEASVYLPDLGDRLPDASSPPPEPLGAAPPPNRWRRNDRMGNEVLEAVFPPRRAEGYDGIVVPPPPPLPAHLRTPAVPSEPVPPPPPVRPGWEAQVFRTCEEEEAREDEDEVMYLPEENHSSTRQTFAPPTRPVPEPEDEDGPFASAQEEAEEARPAGANGTTEEASKKKKAKKKKKKGEQENNPPNSQQRQAAAKDTEVQSPLAHLFKPTAFSGLLASDSEVEEIEEVSPPKPAKAASKAVGAGRASSSIPAATAKATGAGAGSKPSKGLATAKASEVNGSSVPAAVAKSKETQRVKSPVGLRSAASSSSAPVSRAAPADAVRPPAPAIPSSPAEVPSAWSTSKDPTDFFPSAPPRPPPAPLPKAATSLAPAALAAPVAAKPSRLAKPKGPEVKALNPLPQRTAAGALPVPKAAMMVGRGLAAINDSSNAASSQKWTERPVEIITKQKYEEEEDPELQKYIWDRNAQRPKNDQRVYPKAAQVQRKAEPTPAPTPMQQKQLVQQIMAMGFDEPSAKRALNASNWAGVEQAIAMLLG